MKNECWPSVEKNIIGLEKHFIVINKSFNFQVKKLFFIKFRQFTKQT